MNFETLCVHGGFSPEDFSYMPSFPPIYQSTSFLFSGVDDAGSKFSLEEDGHIYSRISNPTVSVLEKRIALLEGGVDAVAVSSGQAAITLSILGLAKSGDEIISSPQLYGGTYTLFKYTLPSMGINVKFVDLCDEDVLCSAITEKTKAVYSETLGNPSLVPLDIEKVAAICHRFGVPLIVDNTFATPYLVRPIDWGADIVVHSMTKYLSGHGSCIAGIIVDSGKFDWAASDRFRHIVEPEPAYHNMDFYRKFSKKVFSARLRYLLLRDIGMALSPLNAYLILLGLETLHLRMRQHSDNAMAVAHYLSGHSKVENVYYPGLSDSPYFDIAKKYFSRELYGGMLCFSLRGGRSSGRKFIEGLRLFYHLANVGDIRSLVIHPATTTHQQLTSEELRACGIDEGFVRLSIGIENVSDIISDIESALSSV